MYFNHLFQLNIVQVPDSMVITLWVFHRKYGNLAIINIRTDWILNFKVILSFHDLFLWWKYQYLLNRGGFPPQVLLFPSQKVKVHVLPRLRDGQIFDMTFRWMPCVLSKSVLSVLSSTLRQELCESLLILVFLPQWCSVVIHCLPCCLGRWELQGLDDHCTWDVQLYGGRLLYWSTLQGRQSRMQKLY